MAKDERKIGRHHLAFYRGWLQGIELAVLAEQYLEDGLDLRLAKSTHRWLQDALSQAALRHGRRGEARLLRTSLRHIVGASNAADEKAQPQAPSIEDFREEEDPDGFYSESELLRMYVEAFPQVIDRRAQRRRNLIQRQLAALKWVESLVDTEPVLDDWVTAWFSKTIADRFLVARIYTLADLHERMRVKGFRWWKDVPRLGVKGAERTTAWLQGYEATLGPVPLKARKPLRQQNAVELFRHRENSLAIVPMELLELSTELSGAVGKNRDPAGAQISARNDIEAIAAWIEARSGSPHTARSYRKEGERMLHWAVKERGKALADISVDDCMAYRNWLGMLGRTDPAQWPYNIPQDQWIGKRNTPRTDEAWRPFDGPLSLASVKQSMVILRGMFLWLVQARYFVNNPWDVVNKKPARGIEDTRDIELTRVLSESQWKFLMEHIASMDGGPEKARLVFVLLLAYSTGMRLAELVDAKLKHLYSMPLSGRLGQRWMLRVQGKGDKLRAVPMGADVHAALQVYLASRGLAPSPAENDPGTPLIAHIQENKALSASALYKLLRDAFKAAAEVMRMRGHAEDAKQMVKASTHWIRHSRGSHLALAGMPLPLIQHLLGHASLNTTSIYLRNNEETLYLALEELERRPANAN